MRARSSDLAAAIRSQRAHLRSRQSIMIGAIISSQTFALTAVSSVRLQGVSRLLQQGHVLRPIRSRASCSWAQYDVVRSGRLAFVLSSGKRGSLQTTSPFNTTARQRLPLEEGSKGSVPSKGHAQVGCMSSIKRDNYSSRMPLQKYTLSIQIELSSAG